MKHLTAIALILISSLSYAAQDPNSVDQKFMKNLIQKAMQERRNIAEFWNEVSKKHGSQALRSLVTILKDEKEPDEMRYASLFGVARMAGKTSYKLLNEYSNHKNWVLRDASIRALAALGATDMRTTIERALKDKALVVRTTAVDAIGHLKLQASYPKLLEALDDPINYKKDHPLWIHNHILSVFSENRWNGATEKLVELLEKRKDPKYRSQIIATLESITGKSFNNKPIEEQVYLWKRNTLSDKNL